MFVTPTTVGTENLLTHWGVTRDAGVVATAETGPDSIWWEIRGEALPAFSQQRPVM